VHLAAPQVAITHLLYEHNQVLHNFESAEALSDASLNRLVKQRLEATHLHKVLFAPDANRLSKQTPKRLKHTVPQDMPSSRAKNSSENTKTPGLPKPATRKPHKHNRNSRSSQHTKPQHQPTPQPAQRTIQISKTPKTNPESSTHIKERCNTASKLQQPKPPKQAQNRKTTQSKR
jgi:hypothetical protein